MAAPPASVAATGTARCKQSIHAQVRASRLRCVDEEHERERERALTSHRTGLRAVTFEEHECTSLSEEIITPNVSSMPGLGEMQCEASGRKVAEVIVAPPHKPRTSQLIYRDQVVMTRRTSSSKRSSKGAVSISYELASQQTRDYEDIDSA